MMLGQIPRIDRDVTLQDYIPGQPIPPLIRDPQSGKIYVNPLKKYVKPYTLSIEPDSITLTGLQTSNIIPMTLDSAGHFEVMRAFFSSSQNEGFTVEIFDAYQRSVFMNAEVHVATIASGLGVTTGYEAFTSATSGGRPFVWPESLWLDVEEGGRGLFVRFRNLSENSNTLRFLLHGRRWYHVQAPYPVANRMQEIYRAKPRTFPYFYTPTVNTRLDGSAATQSVEFRFTDEAWVEWMKSMSVSDSRYNIRILETATQKRLMETAIRDDLVFGNGEFPFLNWESMLFEPNYKLTFELTNGGLVTPNQVWITLGCRKILWDPMDGKMLRPEQASGVTL